MDINDDKFEKYTIEAQERWGKTPTYEEYEKKTNNYTKDDWNSLENGMNLIFQEFSLCVKDGLKAENPRVMMLVKKLQDFITKNYYLCTNDILLGLGQMYVVDERFASNIDKNGEGTALFVFEAIKFYCSHL